MSEKKQPGFEESLKRLDSIVRKLEDTSVSLEESIKLYEEGMEISRYCTKILDEAVLKIEKIDESTDGKSGNETERADQ